MWTPELILKPIHFSWLELKLQVVDVAPEIEIFWQVAVVLFDVVKIRSYYKSGVYKQIKPVWDLFQNSSVKQVDCNSLWQLRVKTQGIIQEAKIRFLKHQHDTKRLYLSFARINQVLQWELQRCKIESCLYQKVGKQRKDNRNKTILKEVARSEVTQVSQCTINHQ